MQTSKFIVAVCAISFCACSLSFAKADDPAQQQAREALRQKMAEVNTHQATPPTAPVAAALVTPKPAPTAETMMPVSVAAIPAVGSFSPVPPPSYDPATERARETLRQKMAEMPAQPIAPEPVVTSAPVVTAPLPAAETAAAEAAARQAKTGKVSPVKKTATPAFAPIESPPLPISAAKQAKLADLLEKYKVDYITPDQYQKERARILAEP